MPKIRKRRSKKSGLDPGTLVHIGEPKTEQVKITIIDYNETQFQIKSPVSCEECYPFKDKPSVSWINIDGIHQGDVIEKIGVHFGLHPLLLEDIMNTDQRPKMEDYDSYLFVVLKMLTINPSGNDVASEQISLVLGQNFVISFQEKEGDIFDVIRERIKNNKGRIRKSGADYLAYSLIDAIVDNYFLVLETIGDRVESLEDELVSNPTESTLRAIHQLKREMLFLRKSVWPLREVISSLEKSESELVKEHTELYLRDIYDHTIHVIDSIETFRDVLSGMLEIYLSSLSHKMNRVMKTLTIIATIFMPLTFLVGIYGMNFNHIPYADRHWGFYSVWGMSFMVAAVMLIYFKVRKWI